MTARKVRISDVMNGKWIKKEGMEPSYIETGQGEHLSRVRILGTVVSKFVSEDANFASITVDDSTETIRAKTFKTAKPLDMINIGEIVDLVGKIREYNEEFYIIPEIVTKVTDPNMELLRRLEMTLDSKKAGPGEKKAGPAAAEEGENLRRKVLEKIESGPAGVSFSEIMTSVAAPEEDIEAVINDLLSEGICYEPTPGKIRKI
jgi:RPA family protein